jgi:hypothetical protein
MAESVGQIKMAEDFGASAAPGTGGYGEVQSRLLAIQALCNKGGEEDPQQALRYARADLAPFFSSTKYTKAQMAQAGKDLGAFLADIQQTLGPIYEHAQVALDQFPKVNEPHEPPSTPALLGHGGSYLGHGDAIDGYLGGLWGPHHGIELRAPARGRVELYTFPTPLDAFTTGADDPSYVQRHNDLFRGWSCMLPHDPQAADVGTLAQTMYVMVYWPDQPLVVDGVTLRWLGGGHCQGASVRPGIVEKGDLLCRTWNSGIDFEARGILARAAHVHAICGRTTTLSPNGDVSGWLALRAFGYDRAGMWEHGVPGPDQYMGGGYIAGRPKSDWAGRPIPPIPA